MLSSFEQIRRRLSKYQDWLVDEIKYIVSASLLVLILNANSRNIGNDILLKLKFQDI